MRGTTTGIIQYCGTCLPPKFVLDPTAPKFALNTPPQPAATPIAPGTPAGALVFDSFSRTNSTLMFGSNGGLGSTENGSFGPIAWQTDRNPATQQPFGILNGVAVLLGNDVALNWVPLNQTDIDVRVGRHKGLYGSGTNTGLSFRVVDRLNYFFAYTSDGASGQTLTIGYFQNGQRMIVADGISLPVGWSALRVITRVAGAIEIYADGTLLYSGVNTLFANATGAGLYNNGAGLGLVNRWDNFTVYPAP